MSQDWEGVPAVQLRVPPPLLVMVMVWACGFVPAVVVKFRVVALNCMAGDGAVTVILMGTATGLPVTAPPVAVLVALMETEVEAFVLPRPVAFTLMVSVALAPPARVPLAGDAMVT